MNFFEAQDNARRVTRWLIALFVVAVISLIGLTEILLISILYVARSDYTAAPGGALPDFLALASSIDISVHITIIAAIILVVAFGALSKFNQLRAGGQVVATLMDGRLVPGNSEDPAQQRLLNVVEEMALASGVPVPQVYVMVRERGINAFAAGWSSDDAVICVTQGMLEALDRNALQGVIGHEFSHILNGDMRMNITVTGILHGILLLGLAGMRLLRVLSYRRRSSRESGAIVAVAVGLVVIGFCGTFFGSLIKAMINRQREYLADASAVQFSRSADGISSALKMIGGYNYGSQLLQPNSAEVSHFFFARATSSWLQGLFATHPPLAERIRRLDPQWDGSYPQVDTSFTQKSMTEELVDDRRDSNWRAGVAPAMAVLAGLDTVLAGQPGDAASVNAAQRLLDSLPSVLLNAARDPFLARTLIFALLLSDDAVSRQRQAKLVETMAEPGIDRYLQSLYTIVASRGREIRLPLVSLAVPALRACSARQIERFISVVKRVIRDDLHVSLYEWCLVTVVTNGVGHDEQSRPRPLGHGRLQQMTVQTRLILSLLAEAVGGGTEHQEQAYSVALSYLQIPWQVPYGKSDLRFESIDHALRRLDELRPLDKQRLLDAGRLLIHQDHDVTVAEAEVFRAIAAALHCPLPVGASL